jgi:hypothetical protein
MFHAFILLIPTAVLSAAVVPEENLIPDQRQRVRVIHVAPSRFNNDPIPTATIINITHVPSRTGIRRPLVDAIAVAAHSPLPDNFSEFLRFAYTETQTHFLFLIIGFLLLIFGCLLIVYLWI